MDNPITKFGLALKEVTYKDNLDWFIQFHDFETLWKANPTYILIQAVFFFGAIVTLIHSFSKGGRWPYFWLGAVLHGIVTEAVAYNMPEIDNFWHTTTPVMFLGNRLAAYILILYPFFIYNAMHAVSRLRLPWWCEPFAVGLMDVVMDLSYDIVSIKFLHWTWHDTDPNIYDRHYWVPWNSYYFHAAFTGSFVFWFTFIRRLSTGDADKSKSAGFFKELFHTVISALLGMPGGVIVFILIYHPLHDVYGIHSENIFIFLATIYFGIVLTGIHTKRETDVKRKTFTDYLLILSVIVHNLVYLIIVVFFKPEDNVSIGYHEPIGNCQTMAEVTSAIGMTLKKRKFLCATDYDEDYFDFKCLPGSRPPPSGSSWYTICGTPYKNRAEYIAIVLNIIVLAFAIFYNLYFNRPEKVEPQKALPKKKTK